MSRASEEPDELEEERRLAYVGITRAKRFFSLPTLIHVRFLVRLAIIVLAVSYVKFQMIYYNIKV
ncbi:MAG: 3'-5' exonuclease [Streptococcus salivarius]